jgi:ribonuclease M5
LQIHETIVVEGKNDESAVKSAVDAEIIITHGFCISETTFENIEWAQKQNGIIVFTDPDTAGEQIRKRINHRIKGCKNAYLTQAEALKKNNIGIENASAENIIDALKNAKCTEIKKTNTFTLEDLQKNNLMGSPDASQRRQKIGKILRIGYANSKQLLNRLNHYNISREEFKQAISKL